MRRFPKIPKHKLDLSIRRLNKKDPVEGPIKISVARKGAGTKKFLDSRPINAAKRMLLVSAEDD